MTASNDARNDARNEAEVLTIKHIPQQQTNRDTHFNIHFRIVGARPWSWLLKLTWLVLGEDPAARSHRVEQFTAL